MFIIVFYIKKVFFSLKLPKVSFDMNDMDNDPTPRYDETDENKLVQQKHKNSKNE